MDDRDRTYFGRGGDDDDQIGLIDPETQAIVGRSYAAEPDVLIGRLKTDEAITEADTLLLTVPNHLGVAYNTHVIELILTHVAPALGWRQGRLGCFEWLASAFAQEAALLDKSVLIRSQSWIVHRYPGSRASVAPAELIRSAGAASGA